MPAIALPDEITAVFREFRTCEFTTLARDGAPITWPTLPFWQPEHGRFLVTTSIGLPQKVFNVRRDGRVSEQKADTAARNSRSRFGASPPSVICLKSEPDTKNA